MSEWDDRELLTASGFDDAIIGVGSRSGRPPLVVYAVERVIEILMDRDGMSNDEAIDFFTCNIEGAWFRELTPIWMYPASGSDLQVH